MRIRDLFFCSLIWIRSTSFFYNLYSHFYFISFLLSHCIYFMSIKETFLVMLVTLKSISLFLPSSEFNDFNSYFHPPKEDY